MASIADSNLTTCTRNSKATGVPTHGAAAADVRGVSPLTRTRRSEHVLLDPEVRHDLGTDFLDRGVRGVERGNVLVAEDVVRDDEFALAAVELRVGAAGPPGFAHLRQARGIDGQAIKTV